MKRALLIGINYTGTSNQLQGCVNDATRRKQTLIEHFGFAEKDIVVLLDNAATTANIKAAFMQLKAQTQNGDIAYVLYSGHGTQIKDETGDEPDGLAEAICPFDFDWSRKHMLTDDDFNAFLQDFKGQFIITLDSCHSGDGLRDIAVKNKFILNPKLFNLVRPHVSRPLICTDGIRRGILLAGCHSDQTSADAYIDGRHCGAFSACMEKALSKSKYNISYAGLITETSKLLKAGNFEQVPELDCSIEFINATFLK